MLLGASLPLLHGNLFHAFCRCQVAKAVPWVGLFFPCPWILLVFQHKRWICRSISGGGFGSSESCTSPANTAVWKYFISPRCSPSFRLPASFEPIPICVHLQFAASLLLPSIFWLHTNRRSLETIWIDLMEIWRLWQWKAQLYGSDRLSVHKKLVTKSPILCRLQKWELYIISSSLIVLPTLMILSWVSWYSS